MFFKNSIHGRLWAVTIDEAMPWGTCHSLSVSSLFFRTCKYQFFL